MTKLSGSENIRETREGSCLFFCQEKKEAAITSGEMRIRLKYNFYLLERCSVMLQKIAFPFSILHSRPSARRARHNHHPLPFIFLLILQSEIPNSVTFLRGFYRNRNFHRASIEVNGKGTRKSRGIAVKWIVRHPKRPADHDRGRQKIQQFSRLHYPIPK